MDQSVSLARGLLDGGRSQAREGQWGMPGHTEARKAAVSCEKPGGGAHSPRAPGGRMGKPGRLLRTVIRSSERRRTRGTETSQYPEGREIKRDAPSSGERNGRSPNRGPGGRGVVGATDGTGDGNRTPLGRGARDGESPVGEAEGPVLVECLSSARPEKSGVKLGGPPSKAKDSRVTDSERVP